MAWGESADAVRSAGDVMLSTAGSREWQREDVTCMRGRGRLLGAERGEPKGTRYGVAILSKEDKLAA